MGLIVKGPPSQVFSHHFSHESVKDAVETINRGPMVGAPQSKPQRNVGLDKG